MWARTPLVAIGGSADYNFGAGDFTIEAWLATATDGPLIQRGAATAGAAGFKIGCDADNTLWATLCDGTTTQTVRSALPVPGFIGGGASHVALTRTATVATLYVNGVAVGNATSGAALSINVTVNVPLTLGHGQPFVDGPAVRPPRSPGGPPSPPAAVVKYALRVSELRVWSNARTQDQLYRAMLIEFHGDEPGLVGYWNFGTANIVDRSTRRNFLVAPYTATICPNTLDLVLPQYVLSLPGGTTSYMAVPSNTSFDFGKGDFTIEVQFASNAPGTLLSRSPELTSPSCGYMVAVTATALTLTLDDGRTPQTYTAPLALLDGNWHHVAWRRKAGVISAFADALIVASSPAASTQDLVSPEPLVVGSNYNATTNTYSAGLVGRINSVSLWPFARPLTDLQSATYRTGEGTATSAVGAWNFDQQAPIDQSRVGANGVLGAGASIVAEYALDATVPLSSLVFSGTQSGVDASARTDLSFGGVAPYTMAAWVRPTAANATGTVLGRFDTAGGPSEFRLRLVNGVPVAERAANNGLVTGATRLNAGYWYFVSMTYDGTTLSVAVNGNTEAQATVGAITAAPGTHVLLGASSAGATTSDWLACGIENVLIWTQALTPAALLGAVRANLAGNEPNLQAYFNFLFGTARDWTGHGPDGVVSSAFFQASTIDEQRIHYARALSGSSVGYIDCGGGRSLTLTNAMTLEAWIRIDRFTDPNQVIMAKGGVYQIRRYGTTNQITFSTAGLQPQAAAELPSTAAVNLLDGAWHHVCAVYDGSNKKLYIDGILNASVAAAGSLAVGNGVLYVADNDGEVLVLDQETGNELWTARTFKAISTSPVVDKNVVCVSSPTGNIFAFDTDTQRRLWDAQIAPGYQVPLRIHRDQVLYSGAGTAISAVDLKTGASAWNSERPGQRGCAGDLRQQRVVLRQLLGLLARNHHDQVELGLQPSRQGAGGARDRPQLRLYQLRRQQRLCAIARRRGRQGRILPGERRADRRTCYPRPHHLHRNG